MKKRIILAVYFLTLLIGICCSSITHANRLMSGMFWPKFTISGHIGFQQFPFIMEFAPRFFNVDEIFERGKVRLSAGLRTTERASFWIGYDVVPIKIRGTARFDVQQRLFEQFFWYKHIGNDHLFTIRSRLEQRFSSIHPQMASVFRQRASIVLYESDTMGNNLVLADEVHFNLDHPDWVPNKLINQNRLSISTSFDTSENTTTTIGYMYQAKFRAPQDKTFHILYITERWSTD